MTDPDPLKGDDRLFIRKGRRHYRPGYSMTEVRIGAAVLVGLGLVSGWIAWKGARPDPELFSSGAELLESEAPASTAVMEGADLRRLSDGPGSNAAPAAGPAASLAGPGADGDAPATPAGGGAGFNPAAGTAGSNPAGRGAAPVPADRGALPPGLAAPGWKEGPVSRFDASNLYVKIDGREDYYKSFGFRELFFVSLTSNEDTETTVDIEMYDLGEAANALGAYAGERSADVSPEVTDSGLAHVDRNAMYMTRGRFYVRAIGSQESPAVRAELAHLKEVMEAGLPGEPLPWAYSLFVGVMGLPFGNVAYAPENAFSFEFADGIYSATLDDRETELFVHRAGNPEEATRMADRFREGFREYGSPVAEAAVASWTKDRYIGTIAGAVSDGVWLMGVRGAPDVTAAESALDRLKKSIASLGGKAGHDGS